MVPKIIALQKNKKKRRKRERKNQSRSKFKKDFKKINSPTSQTVYSFGSY